VKGDEVFCPAKLRAGVGHLAVVQPIPTRIWPSGKLVYPIADLEYLRWRKRVNKNPSVGSKIRTGLRVTERERRYRRSDHTYDGTWPRDALKHDRLQVLETSAMTVFMRLI
jgi:hypothetical protein